MSDNYHFYLSAILTAILNVLLIAFVTRFARNKILKKRFFWYGAAITWWSVFLLLFSFVDSKNLSYLFCQLLHASSIFIPSLFLHFLLCYLKVENKREWITLRASYGISILFWLVNIFKPVYFISSVTTKLGFPYFMNPGPLYTAWMIYFFSIVIYGHAILFFSTIRAEGILKKQRLFFLIGNSLGYLGGLGTFLPVYDVTFFPYPYGVYGVALFSLVTAYTILRFKFFDIEVIIKRTLVFAGLSAFVFACFSIPLFLLQSILSNAVTDQLKVVVLGVSCMVVAALVGPLNQLLVNVTDKYLFQKKYDYQKILKDASRGMSSIEDFSHLIGLVLHFMTMKMRIKNAAIYVKSETMNCFKLASKRGYQGRNIPDRLEMFDVIVKYLDAGKEAVEVERIIEKAEIEGASDSNVTDDIRLIREQMEKLKAKCCVPSFLSGEMRNILVLGEKKSDEDYTDEDLNVLFTLSQESAIAIENARLYDEALKKTKLLAETNKELEDANKRLQVTQASLIVAEKNATMVNMAKAIGHEVNNPLSIIRMKGQKLFTKALAKIFNLLKEGEASKEFKEELKEYVDHIDGDMKKILSAANRIGAVVQTLTGILREPGGEMAPLSPLLLVQEAKEATRFSTYEENLSGCDIVVNVAAHEMILGDTHRLLQVLINLFKNAYEAMEEAGTTDRKIIVDGCVDQEDSDYFRMEVKDNGPGIPPEILDKIWRQDFSTKDKKDDSIGAAGQGQGLFVSKHMIESVHKGSILVDSKVGEGTTFIIKLPRAKME